VLSALCGSSAIASAQTPAGVMAQDAATTGATDVAHEGFEAAPVALETKEETAVEVSAGGLMASGNARSMAGTSAGKVRLRRADNQYSADVAGNYARAAADTAAPMETSVENLQGRVRYDRFLSEAWSAFVAQSARRDRFQGLALRLNFDPGIAYYLLHEENHRLSFELGYDLQFDVRRDDLIAASALEGIDVDKGKVTHSGRGFAGYENKLSAVVSFSTGLEYIQAITERESWRLNWDVGLTSSISESFSLATTFSLRFDNNPLPGVEKTDTTTALSLVYTLL
jgi:putative salt-induced outer membrane protein